jgi:hypothetical protein
MSRIMEHVINEKNLDEADERLSEEHELHPEAPGIGRGAEEMKRLRGPARTVPRCPCDDRVDGGRGRRGRRPP